MTFDYQQVEEHALEMRCDILRMITAAGSGHPGGSLSATDIMATLYFGDVLNYRAEDPTWEQRDRFILSKGHAAPVLYTVLAHAGYFPREELLSLRKFGSRLQGHPDALKLPGIEVSTGSLGQGLSIAAGLAYGLLQEQKRNGDDSPCYVYALLGDGELQEGQIWEAAMFAAHKNLYNLIAIIDNNNLQIDGVVSEVNNPYRIDKKFKAFNWRVFDYVNGHDIRALKHTLDEARHTQAQLPVPSVIIADTIKGKGVSFMEEQCGWHGKAPSADQCVEALKELEVR